jgi:hypothetical protein
MFSVWIFQIRTFYVFTVIKVTVCSTNINNIKMSSITLQITP